MCKKNDCKQLQCSSEENWLNKVWCNHTKIIYEAAEKNEKAFIYEHEMISFIFIVMKMKRQKENSYVFMLTISERWYKLDSV